MNTFPLSQEIIQNTHIYDTAKHNIIQEYLLNFLKKKLSLFNDPQNRVQCIDHGMEKFDIDDDYSAGCHGFCLGQTFADWENTLTIHGTAKFDCGIKFPFGCSFYFRYGDLVGISKQLNDISDSDFMKGVIFNDKNKISIITGFMDNNFTNFHAGFWKF